MIYFFIIWYLIGFISGIVGSIFLDEKLSVRDIIASLLFGFGGVITLVAILAIYVADSDYREKDKILWRKKKE